MARQSRQTSAAPSRGGASLAGSALLWIFAAALIGLAIWAMFVRERSPLMGSFESADALLNGYTEFVRPYAPPSSLSPAQESVDNWLEYFDSASRSWFENNIEKLSFMQYQARPEEWKEFPKGKKKMEAMRYVLTVGPLRGGAIGAVRHSDDGAAATMDIFTGQTTEAVPVAKVDGRWNFTEMMGQRQEIDRRLGLVTLPPK